MYKDHVLVIGEKKKSRYKSEWGRNYYSKNRDKINSYNKAYEERCLKSWEGFIPIETNCEICGKKIYFNKKSLNTSIHFDHRLNGQETIKNSSPNQWLRKHKRTTVHEAIWLSCNFGILCRVCNAHLPTTNRKEYLTKVVKYVFGKGAQIVAP